MSYNIKVKTTEIKPIISMFPKEALKYYCPETNIRIMTTFEYKKPVEGSKEEYEINYARNQILKNQFRIPMKYLEPDSNNTYVCQKAPLTGKSNDIRTAARLIEPLNRGFWDYIRLIPINQDIPEGTIYTIHCKVPYSSDTRYAFMSNQIVRAGKKRDKGYDFDPFIDIGVLDIGSELDGKFTVKQVDLNVYDSYTLFTFRVTDNSFSILTYKFMNVDAKYILTEVIKIAEEKTKPFLQACLKALK